MDSSHQIFQQFKDPRNGSFANVRFYRYRRLAASPADRVLARFDDGAVALAERRVGNGRVVAFTSTIDASWNDFPRHAMFLPVVTEAMTYLAQYSAAVESYTVGRLLDISVAVASLVREGQASRTPGAGDGATGVVVTPSGDQTTLGGSGVPSIELAQQGFYSVRLPGTGDRRPFTVAVNLDPAESDLAALSPTEFVTTAIGPGAVATAGGPSLEQTEVAPADAERRQSLWWYLLVAGLCALLVEALLSNRLSNRSNLGQMQAERA
jgi:hypothetical protein